MYSQEMSWKALLAMYAPDLRSILFMHREPLCSCFCCKKPVLSKLRRIKIKYGMLQ